MAIKMYKKILAVSLLTLFALTVQAQSLFVASYNIRYDNQGDSLKGNGWVTRRDPLCNFLNFEQPDIFGCQEVLVGQLHDMATRLTDYSWIGVGRDDGKEKGEFEPIFYNKKRLEMLNHGHFWLAPDPTKPVLGWDAACVRLCTWGQFRERYTGFTFFFFNLHMDHVGVTARRESAKLIVSKMKTIAKGKPVVMTGDFNVDQDNEIYKIFAESGILKDSYSAAKQRFAENGTFNSFSIMGYTKSRIDHIFVSPKFEVDHYAVHTDGYWAPVEGAEAKQANDAPSEVKIVEYTRHNMSDHYPVMAKIRFK